jgi:hypothetical protein
MPEAQHVHLLANVRAAVLGLPTTRAASWASGGWDAVSQKNVLAILHSALEPATHEVTVTTLAGLNELDASTCVADALGGASRAASLQEHINGVANAYPGEDFRYAEWFPITVLVPATRSIGENDA